jgi:ketosteroid isomerase-like protein
VELVRGAYAESGGLAEPPAWAAPDIEFDLTAVYPDGQVLRGVEAMRRFIEEHWGDSQSFEPERFFDVDDERVLVFVRGTAVGKDSGATVEVRLAHELTIRDGLVVRFKSYADRDEALRAVGLAQ